MAIKIIKNSTGSPVDIADVGARVPASGQITVDPREFALFASSSSLKTLIDATTLVINDGTNDITDTEVAKEFMDLGTDAFGLRFYPDAVRSNGFTSTNVQEAIEEAAELPITTKGDILTYGTGPDRLPVGTDGQFLVADSAQALGIKWSTSSSSLSIGQSITSATAGSVLFADGSSNLGQDNSNFFWDITNKRLGIGTATPSNSLHLYAATGTKTIKVESGTQNLQIFANTAQWPKMGTISNHDFSLLANSNEYLRLEASSGALQFRTHVQGIGSYTLGTTTLPFYEVHGSGFYINNGVGNTIRLYASTITSSYALKFPSVQGGASTFLRNDGSGNLSWVSSTAGDLQTVYDASVDGQIDLSTGIGKILLKEAAFWSGNSFEIQTSTSVIRFAVDGTSITIGQDALPRVTNTYDLGSSSLKYVEGWINEVYAGTAVYGGNSASVNLILQSTNNVTRGDVKCVDDLQLDNGTAGQNLLLRESRGTTGSAILFDSSAVDGSSGNTQKIFGSYLSGSFPTLNLFTHQSNYQFQHTLTSSFFNNGRFNIRLGATSNLNLFAVQNFSSVDRAYIDGLGNLRLGENNPVAANTGVGVIVLSNAVTAPTTATANAVTLYAKDVSASSELFVRDESNTETQLSSHAVDLIVQSSLDRMNKTIHDKNQYIGWRRQIDEAKAFRWLQRLVDEYYPNEDIVERTFYYEQEVGVQSSWDTDELAIKALKDAERLNWGYLIDENGNKVSDIAHNDETGYVKNPEHYDSNGSLKPAPDEYVLRPIPEQIAEKV